MESTEWSNYGTESGNPRCANCMVHSGYEASGVNYTFGSLRGLLQTAKAMFARYDDAGAQTLLNEWKPANHEELVQIGTPVISAASAVANHESTMVSGD